MDTKKITFDNLPDAMTYLIQEMNAIKSMIVTINSPPPKQRLPIGIDAACELLKKAKPTIYALARKGLLPCYKNGKKLYFFEDELLEWIQKGKRKTVQEIREKAENRIYGTKRG